MTAASPSSSTIPGTGIDRLLADPALLTRLRTARTGLLTHDACRTADGTPTRRALAAALHQPDTGSRNRSGLVRLFSPEHGMATNAAAGAAVSDTVDIETGVPVISLYGERQHAEPEYLDDLDFIVVDLRDVGVRCFTYAATAARLISAAALQRVEIVVCDRPNPLGGLTAGPQLDPALRSLVAWFDVPFVHGRSIAGLLADEAQRQGQKPPLVVACGDDDRESPARDRVPPSPALDHPDAIRLYPGLVLLEGTNLDEGRGTPTPFRSIAAPWLDPAALASDIAQWGLPISATETALSPTTGAYSGQQLPALVFSLSPASRSTVTLDGFSFGIHLLCAIAARHSEFSWTTTSVGGTGTGFWIDALLGNTGLRSAMAEGDDAATILARWQA